MAKQTNFKVLIPLGILALMLLLIQIPALKTGLAGNTSSFNVSLTIGNSLPLVYFVQALSTSPLEGTSKSIYIIFNASDSNGVADIPGANAVVVINRSGVSHTSSGCVVAAATSTVNEYNCTVSIDYYDLPGTWTINASVYDGSSTVVWNASQSVTMGYTYGIALKTTSLTFSGSPGQADVAPSNQPQTVNNTGNGAFTQMSLKAYDLYYSGTYIGVSNFTANTSSSGGAGHLMLNNTAVVLDNSAVAVQGMKNISVYMDIPTGLPNGNYVSTNMWIVTAS